MSEYKVTLKTFERGWAWTVEYAGQEMTGWAYTKSGAKRAVSKRVKHWNNVPLIETYTIKGGNK